MTQNDVMQLFIVKDGGAGTPTTSAGDIIKEATDTYLLDGEAAVCNAHNQVISAASCLTDDIVKESGIKIIQRTGSVLIHSDLIMQANILNYKGETGVAAVEQVSYIGYNSSANDIEINNSTLYVIRLLLKEQDTTGFGQQIILNAPYKSDASATQEEIGLGLALALSNVLRRQAVVPIKAELLNSNAVDTADAYDATATVVNGSRTFSVGTSLAAGGVASVVGDYVRFSATRTVTGTALTDGVYRIASISSLNVTVDRPIEAASGVYTAALGVAEVILAAEAQAADFGIKLTGVARTFASLPPKNRYTKVSFDIGLDDGFGDTVTTYTTAMNLGKGTYEQVAELEYDLVGNDGDVYKGDFLYSQWKTDATSGATYSVLSLNYYGDHPTQGIGANPRRSKQLQVAFTQGFADTEASDIIIEVFDAYTTQTSGLTV